MKREREALLDAEREIVLGHLLNRRMIVLRLGNGGELLDASRLFETFFDRDFTDCAGSKPWQIDRSGSIGTPAWKNLATAIANHRPWAGELSFQGAAGQTRHADAALEPIGGGGFLLSLLDRTGYAGEMERLGVANERYRMALWGSNFAVFDWNIITGENYLSPRFYEMTALTAAEYDGSLEAFRTRVHPDDEEATMASLRGLIEEHRTYDSEYRFKDGRGEWMWLRARGHALWDAGGRLVRMAGSLEDIGQRKEAEAAALLIEKRYRDAIHAARGVAYELRFGGPGQPDEYIFMDERLEDFAGIPASRLTRKAALELERDAVIHHPEFDGDREAFHRRFLRGEIDIYQSDLRIRTHDGGEKWLSDISIPVFDDRHEKVIGSLGILQDITGRKVTELSLSRQLARMELLNRIVRVVAEEGTTDDIFAVVLSALASDLRADFAGFFSLGSTTGEVVVKQTRPAGFAGIEPGAVYHVPPDDATSLFAHGRLLVHSAGDHDCPLCGPLIDHGMESIVMVPLRTGEGPIGMLVVGRCEEDAFSRGEDDFLAQLSHHVALALGQHRLQEELEKVIVDLKETQRQLLHQERLRAMGQMASGIAHDINNALAPLTMYPEMLLATEENLSPQVREVLELINHSALNIAQTVSRLGELYKRQDNEGERRLVDLNALVTRVVDLTRPRWRDIARQQGAEIRVSTNLATDLPPIRAIEGEIRDALTNLCFNAVDAMARGGRIELTTRRVSGGAELSCRDTGIGMDEETRLQCLEPFFTTKGHHGTGLGLPMVHAVVERHNGTIRVDSAPGKGTTFTIFLPAAPTVGLPSAPGTTPQATRAATSVPPSRCAHLLIVDDDVSVRKALAMSLLKEGYDVAVAESGHDAIAQFEQAANAGNVFDAVITDLGMPEMDGAELAGRLRKAWPATPIILLTGWGVHFGKLRQQPDSVDVVLSKPPLIQELRNALDRLLPPGE